MATYLDSVSNDFFAIFIISTLIVLGVLIRSIERKTGYYSEMSDVANRVMFFITTFLITEKKKY